MNFKTYMNRAPACSISGMSLVEILVAMLIGLLGMVIITQVYSVSEERKRTTSGVGDAQVTGNIAMFTLERDLRPAGFGMVSAATNMLGCATTFFDSALATPTFTRSMAPVQIAIGAAGAPDSLTIIYGNSSTAAEGAAFRAPETSAPFPLKNAAGFQVGDFVVVSESGTCQTARITAFTPAALNDVEHTPSNHNPPGGSGFNSASALLFSLGRAPVVKTYSVSSDKLISQTLFPQVSGQVAEIADGVVQLKAQYGKDTNNDRIVDTWDTVTPTTNLLWLQVRAIRVALVARSGQYEKTQVTPVCVNPADMVPPAVYWSGGCITMTNPIDGTDWRRYRYRVYEVVVPLRNMIWSTD